MAIACCDDLAPCLPWRMSSISSRTNSPACVLADLPARLSCMAFLTVCFLGIDSSLHCSARLARQKRLGPRNDPSQGTKTPWCAQSIFWNVGDGQLFLPAIPQEGEPDGLEPSGRQLEGDQGQGQAELGQAD